MNLVNGVIATPVGVLLWRSLVGAAGATTSTHQTTGVITSMVDPIVVDTERRIQVTLLEGNGTAAGTSSRGTINRGARMRGTTKEAAGRIIEEGTGNGVHCTPRACPKRSGHRGWLLIEWRNRRVLLRDELFVAFDLCSQWLLANWYV